MMNLRTLYFSSSTYLSPLVHPTTHTPVVSSLQQTYRTPFLSLFKYLSWKIRHGEIFSRTNFEALFILKEKRIRFGLVSPFVKDPEDIISALGYKHFLKDHCVQNEVHFFHLLCSHCKNFNSVSLTPDQISSGRACFGNVESALHTLRS